MRLNNVYSLLPVLRYVSRGLCLALALSMPIALSGCTSKPGIEWESFSWERYDAAKSSGHPTLIFFTAAWCSICYHVKENEFTDPRLIERTLPYNRLKADLSYSKSEKVRKIEGFFEVEGVPMLIALDENGKEFARWPGYVRAEELLRIL